LANDIYIMELLVRLNYLDSVWDYSRTLVVLLSLIRKVRQKHVVYWTILYTFRHRELYTKRKFRYT